MTLPCDKGFCKTQPREGICAIACENNPQTIANAEQKRRARTRLTASAEAHEARKIEEQKNTASLTLPFLKMRTHRVSLFDHREGGIIEAMRDESESRRAEITVRRTLSHSGSYSFSSTTPILSTASRR